MSYAGQQLFRGFGDEFDDALAATGAKWNAASANVTREEDSTFGQSQAQPPSYVQSNVGTRTDVAQENNAGMGTSILGAITSIASGLVNIFGQKVAQPVIQRPPVPMIPTWVYVAIPVAAIGAFMLLSKRRSGSLAGYRRKSRRKSRR